MDAVKCTREDQIVIAIKLLQAWCERAIVDQSTGFVDDEQGEDNP